MRLFHQGLRRWYLGNLGICFTASGRGDGFGNINVGSIYFLPTTMFIEGTGNHQPIIFVALLNSIWKWRIHFMCWIYFSLRNSIVLFWLRRQLWKRNILKCILFPAMNRQESCCTFDALERYPDAKIFLAGELLECWRRKRTRTIPCLPSWAALLGNYCCQYLSFHK